VLVGELLCCVSVRTLIFKYPFFIQVCGRSPAEIVGSNPTGEHGCLTVVSVVCCQVEVSATS
jgi:hypothetical protein